MAMGEPKCAGCGADIISGVEHRCQICPDCDGLRRRIRTLEDTNDANCRVMAHLEKQLAAADKSYYRARTILDLLLKYKSASLHQNMCPEDDTCRCDAVKMVNLVMEGYEPKPVAQPVETPFSEEDLALLRSSPFEGPTEPWLKDHIQTCKGCCPCCGNHCPEYDGTSCGASRK